MSTDLTFVYVTYIRSSAENIWRAITDVDVTYKYWGHINVSDWKVSSKWEHQRGDATGTVDVVGIVTECSPPTRLAFTWAEPTAVLREDPSRVTIKIDSYLDIVRLTVNHENLADKAELDAVTEGWAAVLSNLKTFIETGQALPQKPWDMPN
jgi:uncharacterized protein YndB with AHSA1/START domain